MLGLSLCLIESEKLLIKGHTLNLAESGTQMGSESSSPGVWSENLLLQNSPMWL